MSTKRKRTASGHALPIQNKTPTKRTPGRVHANAEPASNSPSVSKGLSREITGLALDEVFTPTKADRTGTTSKRGEADRSARRKSTRRLLERAAADLSEEEPEEDDLAEQIRLETGESDSAEDDRQAVLEDEQCQPTTTKTIDEIIAEPIFLDTPSKRGRGRPKGSRNRSLTPPLLGAPPQEQYFYQNRASVLKATSNTAFPTEALISHAAYHDTISECKDSRHEEALDNLFHHHESQFPLWSFELSQGFNILLHGYGRKKGLLTSFADYLHSRTGLNSADTASTKGTAKSKTRGNGRLSQATVVVGNGKVHSSPTPITIILDGHHPNLTSRSLIATIAENALPPSLAAALPLQPADACTYLLRHLPRSKESSSHIYILIDPIHATSLTRAPFPLILTQLVSREEISLLATADDAHFPLLWSLPMQEKLNWIFHDGTTFVPYDGEGKDSGTIASQGVVDAVNELLGRKGASGKGREGVRWVLSSLPENARSVYRILVTEILSLAEDDGNVQREVEDEDDIMGGFDDDGDVHAKARVRKRHGGFGELPAVGHKTLYSKAVEGFLCSSEMAFRGLLKEFMDHQMVVSGRDASGAETLGIEMRREELEGVLEDMMLE